MRTRLLEEGFSGEDQSRISWPAVEKIGSEALSLLGLDVSKWREDCFLSCFFTGSEWKDQVFIGIPVRGLSNNNQGADVETGCCGRFTQQPALCRLIRSDSLTDLLKEMKYVGWVSVWISSEDLKITRLETGIASWGLYNILEGVQGALRAWFENPGQRLRESWTVSTLYSRYPFPGEESSELVRISGLVGGIKKHFWCGEVRIKNGACGTVKTQIGIATGWGLTPHKAEFFVRKTLETVVVEKTQFRTDIASTAWKVWEKVRGHFIIP